MYDNPNDKIKEPPGNLPIDQLARSQLRDFTVSASRKRREEGAKHWGFVGLIWLIFICVGAAFLFKVWHMLAPASMCWMTNDNIAKINEFLTTGALSGGAGAYIRTKISNDSAGAK